MRISKLRSEEEVQAAITSCPILPYGQRIIVLESEVVEKTEGGIFLPETQREYESTEGYVLSVGPEVTACKPGDRIYFGKHSGMRGVVDGIEYRVMNEEDMLGLYKAEVLYA